MNSLLKEKIYIVVFLSLWVEYYICLVEVKVVIVTEFINTYVIYNNLKPGLIDVMC